ncbi:MAG: acyl carrier protein [Planctomycetota bacterium]
MTEQEILLKIRQLTAEKLGKPLEQILPDSNFQSDLDFDSLDISEIVMDIEDAFNISVPEDQIESLTTPQKVTDLLKTLIK